MASIRITSIAPRSPLAARIDRIDGALTVSAPSAGVYQIYVGYALAADDRPLELSVNGVHWSSSGLSFEYLEDAELTSIEPASGPESGGTRVYIGGAHLGPRGDVVCDFGSSAARSAARLAARARGTGTACEWKGTR